jgi:transposase
MKNRDALQKIALRMRREGQSLRHIARTLGLHRSTLCRLLDPPKEGEEKTRPARPSKLDPFKPRAEELSLIPKMTQRGIYTLLRQEGYAGSRTILGDYLRTLRGTRQSQKAFLRYEPPPGLEAQTDWSPYTVPVGGKKEKIHVFSMILSYSRYLYLEAFLDEKQDTLFQGHIEAFRFFEGIPSVILYDNQTPVVSCRMGKDVILNPRFEKFAAHYGFQPKICLPYDKERKGRVERPFGYLASSFFPGREFASLEDVREKLRAWLMDEVLATGNFRIHGTTRKRPVDRWAEEKDLLIQRPETDFLPTRVEERLVAKDCMISVLGNFFTVPPRYVGKKVTVILSPKGITVCNPRGEKIAAHTIPEGKGKMVIDEAHYAEIRRRKKKRSAPELEDHFQALFPKNTRFLAGLKKRVKGTYPIHLTHLKKLLEHFTVKQMEGALDEALSHGIFTSTYVEELLFRRYPSQLGARSFDERLEKPKGFRLGHLEIGDLEGYDDIFQKEGGHDGSADA